MPPQVTCTKVEAPATTEPLPDLGLGKEARKAVDSVTSRAHEPGAPASTSRFLRRLTLESRTHGVPTP